ncbi:hypothetical protein J2S43_006248 [Catenuloplanes nepalensis]|uniref:DUF4175 domain-containing protein n=1 Tax=Catenuloplanes nepalensis TaxID=587533 RepID=A0ABT9N370_9ACTN|nr:hypothetical protein [Catenuloplanes nepalensis]MDP9797736.1 hypothetical protein [Catenuloplanes nepalensis]
MADEQGKLAALGSAIPVALRRSLALLSMFAGGWLIFMSATSVANPRLVVLATGYLLGGALLLYAARWHVLTAWTSGAAALLAPAGTGASLLVRDQGSPAAFSYTLRRGYPLHAMHKTAPGETVPIARAALDDVPWRPDWGHAAADALFWAYCGLAFAILVTLAVRSLSKN